MALSVKERIKKHEGLVLKPYQDTKGIWTIGYGFNLEANDLPKDVAEYLFELSYARAEVQARFFFPWFESLDEVRQGVVIEMIYNIGIASFRKFKRMHAQISLGNFEAAGEEMLDSRWSKEVGKRATTLAGIMKTGKEA